MCLALIQATKNFRHYLPNNKLLSRKGKRNLHDLFEEQNPKHLEQNEGFDDRLDNDGFGDTVLEEGMQDLNMNDQFCEHLVL